VAVFKLPEACIKLGGEKSLAHQLGISVGIVRMLLSYDVFLKCVDLLDDDAAPKN
jgi:hypothetical protein